MRRRQFIRLLGGAAAWPLAARAQQAAGEVPRVGYLTQGARPRVAEIFLAGLRELGWVEGQNVAMEWRVAAGRLDQLAPLAADLVRLKVNVIVTQATPAAKAAQNATSSIPIVIIDPGDPVEARLVASLARPGGNITGQTSIAPDLAAKRLELLKEIVPTISRVAVLWNSAIPPAEVALKELRAAAAILKVEIRSVEVQGPQGFEGAFASIVRERADALFVFPDPLTFGSEDLIVGMANKGLVPTMFGAREFVDVGGLISYGPSYPDMFRRAGNYAGRILKGTKPGDLPVEQPTKFELVINLKTAKALGVTVTRELQFLADEIIE
jgi:putative ABC transport system substrate-binding protein